MQARVIALGQTAAGDDGVGFAVLEELGRRNVSPDIDLCRVHEAIDLVPLLHTPARVVLVDAALGTYPGDIIALGADEIPDDESRSFSSHGMGVGAVVRLARTLSPGRISSSIRLVAITIARPNCFGHGLTPAVAAAVDRAADKVLELAGD